MIKIKIYFVGKWKEHWLQDALDLYETRLRPSISLQWILAKTDEQLKQFLKKEPYFICLDPQGKQYSSQDFSRFLTSAIQQAHCRLSFIIGGAAGIPVSIKSQSKSLLSLSSMTFTHEMTRLILLEQIYRASEIQKGSPYHK